MGPLSRRVREQLSQGTHLICLDYDAVLGAASSTLIDGVRRLACLPRVRLVILSDRELGELAPLCVGIDPVWIAGSGGRVIVDPSRRMSVCNMGLADRLRSLAGEAGARTVLYIGPDAYPVSTDDIASVPLAAGVPVADRTALVSEIASALNSG